MKSKMAYCFDEDDDSENRKGEKIIALRSRSRTLRIFMNQCFPFTGLTLS